MSWTTILVLAGGAYLFKAVGLLAGGAGLERTGPMATGVERIGRFLPPALLTALVVTQTVAIGNRLVLDARLPGVAAGAVAAWRGAPFWLVVAVAAGVTAGLRLLFG